MGVVNERRFVFGRPVLIVLTATITAVDPLAIAFTGNDRALITALCRTITTGVILTPGFGEAYAAWEENGELAGYLLFTLPGKLLFAT